MSETVDQNYARAGCLVKQNWGKRPALVLADFAHAYFDQSHHSMDEKAVSPRASKQFIRRNRGGFP